ncbi:MAG: ATP-binding cassette domain-containing protein [Lysinibacillus sp.]
MSQHSYNNNPRSTIGTYTDFSEYSRALYAYVINYYEKKNYKPNDFSFNNPKSSCKCCQGTGESYIVDFKKVIPEKKKTLNQHAILFFKGNEKSLEFQTLKQFCDKENIPMDEPFENLPNAIQELLLYGNGDCEYEVKYKTVKNRYKTTKVIFKGAIKAIQEELEFLNTPSVFRNIQKYLILDKCPICFGLKLDTEFLNLKINNYNISEVENLTFRRLKEWLEEVDELHGEALPNIKDITKNMKMKLNALLTLNIGYLSPSRTIPSLSGGELQRVRIAAQLNNPLIGLLYIFDEPCKGLHKKDVSKIVSSINDLTKKGNTIVAIEHNLEFISKMDNVIYMGPAGGTNGGRIISEEEYMSSHSETIFSKERIQTDEYLKLQGVTKNNLKNLNCSIPKKGLTAIAGVSGSGKSTLLKVIYESLKNKVPINSEALLGMDNIGKVYLLNQKPIHNNKRSTVSTYLEVSEEIRNIFANLEESRMRKYNASYFSPNVVEGRCENCKGQGEIKIEMTYLDDMYVPCEDCKGTGFKESILEIKYKNKNIAEFFNTEVELLLDMLPNKNIIYKKLLILNELGMGYIKLGQPSMSLSGGEAQRVKLAKVLGKNVERNAFFLLDEPTAGLSTSDINKLSKVLDEICKKNAAIVIEHNAEFIQNNADYLIDLGITAGDSVKMECLEGTVENVYHLSSLI